MYRVSHFVTSFALCLLGGAAIAMVWANLFPHNYADFIEMRLGDSAWVGYPNPDSPLPFGRTLTLGYLTGNVLMSFFFLYVGKELWEALVLKHGSLHGRRAVAPFVTALAAAIVPALIYWLLSHAVTRPSLPSTGAGWPVAMAGDVSLSYVVGRLVLGKGHPALRFLLVISIADDFLALLATGIAAPMASSVRWSGLWLAGGVAVAVFVLFNWLPRWLDRGKSLSPAVAFVNRLSIWPYAVAGVVSWYGVQMAGLPPALGLLPIIPAIPHADRAFGEFAEAEELLSDMLNRIGHLLVIPVAVILFLFALTHAGVSFAATDTESFAVLGALLIGKPLGVWLGGWGILRMRGVSLPNGMAREDLVVVGIVAAIGMAVPLFAVGATLPLGSLQEGAKVGLVFSAIAAPLALAAARTIGALRH
jgi:Na+:H+ antiporter, NhaA family